VPAQANALVAALKPWSTGGLLPNFAPSADPARMARAYDEHTRQELARWPTGMTRMASSRPGRLVRFPA
jgi:hypothetical protein